MHLKLIFKDFAVSWCQYPEN